MNSIHDIGGLDGVGPLPLEENEPPFHENWERRMFGVKVALAIEGVYNIDETRWAMERIPALRWLQSSYYEQWVDGVTRSLLEKNILTQEEIDARIDALSKQGDI